MSNYLGPETDHDCVFECGEIVSFDHKGDRLTGRVVRVYASRLNYHIEVDGSRYEVSVPEDHPRREAYE